MPSPKIQHYPTKEDVEKANAKKIAIFLSNQNRERVTITTTHYNRALQQILEQFPLVIGQRYVQCMDAVESRENSERQSRQLILQEHSSRQQITDAERLELTKLSQRNPVMTLKVAGNALVFVGKVKKKVKKTMLGGTMEQSVVEHSMELAVDPRNKEVTLDDLPQADQDGNSIEEDSVEDEEEASAVVNLQSILSDTKKEKEGGTKIDEAAKVSVLQPQRTKEESIADQNQKRRTSIGVDERRFQFQILKCQNLRLPQNQKAHPSPFVQFYSPTGECIGHSTTIENSSNPKWDSLVCFLECVIKERGEERKAERGMGCYQWRVCDAAATPIMTNSSTATNPVADSVIGCAELPTERILAEGSAGYKLPLQSSFNHGDVDEKEGSETENTGTIFISFNLVEEGKEAAVKQQREEVVEVQKEPEQEEEPEPAKVDPQIEYPPKKKNREVKSQYNSKGSRNSTKVNMLIAQDEKMRAILSHQEHYQRVIFRILWKTEVKVLQCFLRSKTDIIVKVAHVQLTKDIEETRSNLQHFEVRLRERIFVDFEKTSLEVFGVDVSATRKERDALALATLVTSEGFRREEIKNKALELTQHLYKVASRAITLAVIRERAFHKIKVDIKMGMVVLNFLEEIEVTRRHILNEAEAQERKWKLTESSLRFFLKLKQKFAFIQSSKVPDFSSHIHSSSQRWLVQLPPKVICSSQIGAHRATQLHTFFDGRIFLKRKQEDTVKALRSNSRYCFLSSLRQMWSRQAVKKREVENDGKQEEGDRGGNKFQKRNGAIHQVVHTVLLWRCFQQSKIFQLRRNLEVQKEEMLRKAGGRVSPSSSKEISSSKNTKTQKKMMGNNPVSPPWLLRVKIRKKLLAFGTMILKNKSKSSSNSSCKTTTKNYSRSDSFCLWRQHPVVQYCRSRFRLNCMMARLEQRRERCTSMIQRVFHAFNARYKLAKLRRRRQKEFCSAKSIQRLAKNWLVRSKTSIFSHAHVIACLKKNRDAMEARDLHAQKTVFRLLATIEVQRHLRSKADVQHRVTRVSSLTKWAGYAIFTFLHRAISLKRTRELKRQDFAKMKREKNLQLANFSATMIQSLFRSFWCRTRTLPLIREKRQRTILEREKKERENHAARILQRTLQLYRSRSVLREKIAKRNSRRLKIERWELLKYCLQLIQRNMKRYVYRQRFRRAQEAQYQSQLSNIGEKLSKLRGGRRPATKKSFNTSSEDGARHSSPTASPHHRSTHSELDISRESVLNRTANSPNRSMLGSPPRKAHQQDQARSHRKSMKEFPSGLAAPSSHASYMTTSTSVSPQRKPRQQKTEMHYSTSPPRQEEVQSIIKSSKKGGGGKDNEDPYQQVSPYEIPAHWSDEKQRNYVHLRARHRDIMKALSAYTKEEEKGDEDSNFDAAEGTQNNNSRHRYPPEDRSEHHHQHQQHHMNSFPSSQMHKISRVAVNRPSSASHPKGVSRQDESASTTGYPQQRRPRSAPLRRGNEFSNNNAPISSMAMMEQRERHDQLMGKPAPKPHPLLRNMNTFNQRRSAAVAFQKQNKEFGGSSDFESSSSPHLLVNNDGPLSPQHQQQQKPASMEQQQNNVVVARREKVFPHPFHSNIVRPSSSSFRPANPLVLDQLQTEVQDILKERLTTHYYHTLGHQSTTEYRKPTMKGRLLSTGKHVAYEK